MLKYYLANKDGTPVEVNQDPGEKVGLVVATRPHKTFASRTAWATHPHHGIEMNQNGKYGGTPLLLHDGTDTVAWTFSEPTGSKWEADSTDHFYDTAKALKCDNANIGDIVQAINNVGPGNNVVLTGNYVAMTMWIFVDKSWKIGGSFPIYAHLDGALEGNAVNLEDYFDYTNHDIWQFIAIPLTDMGLTASSVDAFRIENIARAGAKSPTFYIDEWQLEESGALIEFTIEPALGTWFHIESYQTLFVDAYNADNADSTMPHLSYDQILGDTFEEGYLYEQYGEGNPIPMFSVRVLNLADLLQFAQSKLSNYISDGTNTLITVSQDQIVPLTLKAEKRDKVVITLQDDFSSLLRFRMTATGREEIRR